MTQCNSRSCMLPTIPCCHNLYRTAETIAVLQLLYSATPGTAGIGPQRQKIHCFQRQKKPYLFDFHMFAISSKKTNSKWLDRIFEPQATLVGTRISHVFFFWDPKDLLPMLQPGSKNPIKADDLEKLVKFCQDSRFWTASLDHREIKSSTGFLRGFRVKDIDIMRYQGEVIICNSRNRNHWCGTEKDQIYYDRFTLQIIKKHSQPLTMRCRKQFDFLRIPQQTARNLQQPHLASLEGGFHLQLVKDVDCWEWYSLVVLTCWRVFKAWVLFHCNLAFLGW